MGYSPWGREESDTTERLTLSLSPPGHRLGDFGVQSQKGGMGWAHILAPDDLDPSGIPVLVPGPGHCHHPSVAEG